MSLPSNAVAMQLPFFPAFSTFTFLFCSDFCNIFMAKFSFSHLHFQNIRNFPFPSAFCEQFEPIFSQMKNTSMDPLQDISSTVDLLSLSDGPVTKSNLWLDVGSRTCISPHKVDYLDDDELSYSLNLQPSSGESEKIIRKRHVSYSSVPQGKI